MSYTIFVFGILGNIFIMFSELILGFIQFYILCVLAITVPTIILISFVYRNLGKNPHEAFDDASLLALVGTAMQWGTWIFLPMIILAMITGGGIINFVIFAASVVYLICLAILVYHTAFFVLRLRELYRTPDLSRLHVRPDGTLDVRAIGQDAPTISDVLGRPAWKTDTHIVRAAQAVAALKSRETGAQGRARPKLSFVEPGRTRSEAAQVLLGTYFHYIQEATVVAENDAYQHEIRRRRRES